MMKSAEIIYQSDTYTTAIGSLSPGLSSPANSNNETSDNRIIGIIKPKFTITYIGTIATMNEYINISIDFFSLDSIL